MFPHFCLHVVANGCINSVLTLLQDCFSVSCALQRPLMFIFFKNSLTAVCLKQNQKLRAIPTNVEVMSSQNTWHRLRISLHNSTTLLYSFLRVLIDLIWVIHHIIGIGSKHLNHLAWPKKMQQVCDKQPGYQAYWECQSHDKQAKVLVSAPGQPTAVCFSLYNFSSAILPWLLLWW